jgi:hypothetical protein
MSTDTLELIELDIDFESVPRCEYEDCETGEEAHWISHHPGCSILVCDECADLDRSVFAESFEEGFTVICECGREFEPEEFEVLPL